MHIHPLREAIEDYGIAEALLTVVQVALSRPSAPCLDAEEMDKFVRSIEDLRERFEVYETKWRIEPEYK